MSSVLCNTFIFPIQERTYKYTNNHWISGFFGGLFQGPIVYLFDLGKIKRQTQKPNLTFKTIIKNKGKFSTLLNDSLGLTVYFGTYHTLREHSYSPVLSGGLAGLANWTLTYPIDVVKSRQISQNISILKSVKLGNLYKGYSICATRAILVNSVNFCVYEKVKQLF